MPPRKRFYTHKTAFKCFSGNAILKAINVRLKHRAKSTDRYVDVKFNFIIYNHEQRIVRLNHA